jgi:ribonucleoside-diphosphate reductase beta chain|tara:strand:- start:5525 stop:6601 length:1077 start_codon:yes stop_codon:yes gene_type:complete
MSVFKVNKKSSKSRNLFFDGGVDIARYDEIKYPQIDKLTDKQLGFFWRPEEVDILKDSKDFKDLTDSEKHIFTSNLKRQILLDSIQGRAPNLAFLPISSLPELETWIETWSFSETIHSRSYTHIIRNIYTQPSEVFDTMLDIKEIVECANSISTYYDDLVNRNQISAGYGSYGHKKALWLALNAVNALEGVRFYVSFACSWAFAELKKMEGNAKIIKFIARDENVHLASTMHLIKLLPKDDKDFLKIQEECKEDVLNIFTEVVEQEKEWADYLFKDGSMIGLNANVLKSYVEWIAAKRASALGIEHNFTGGTNPLPWTQKWIVGSSVQVAPQETEISSYITGGVKKDVSADTFTGFKL